MSTYTVSMSEWAPISTGTSSCTNMKYNTDWKILLYCITATQMNNMEDYESCTTHSTSATWFGRPDKYSFTVNREKALDDLANFPYAISARLNFAG